MSQRVRFCHTFPSQQASHVPNEDGSHDRRILPIRFAAVGRTEADRLSVDALITPGIPVERRTCLYRGNNNLQHRARLVLLIPARLVNGLHVNIRGCWTNRSGLDFLFFSFVSFFFFSFLFFFWVSACGLTNVTRTRHNIEKHLPPIPEKSRDENPDATFEKLIPWYDTLRRYLF